VDDWKVDDRGEGPRGSGLGGGESRGGVVGHVEHGGRRRWTGRWRLGGGAEPGGPRLVQIGTNIRRTTRIGTNTRKPRGEDARRVCTRGG
jgi:hypothetical protein